MAYIRSSTSGFHTVYIARCTSDDLRHLLDPGVPVVHVWYHHPGDSNRWHEDWLSLYRGGPRQPLRVRHLQFDFEMATADFLTNLHRVTQGGDGGMNLIHLSQGLPDGLSPWHARGAEDHAKLFDRLVAHGMQARFSLPHAGEVGEFTTRSRTMLEHALENESIRARCIEYDEAK